MSRKKSLEEYERLFEDFMSYAGYTDINQILGSDYEETKDNLKTFFGKFDKRRVKDGYRAGGSFRSGFMYEFSSAFWRKVKREGKQTRFREKIGGVVEFEKAEKVAYGKKPQKRRSALQRLAVSPYYTSYVSAKERGNVFRIKRKNVYKSYRIIKGKKQTIFRDKNNKQVRVKYMKKKYK